MQKRREMRWVNVEEKEMSKCERAKRWSNNQGKEKKIVMVNVYETTKGKCAR